MVAATVPVEVTVTDFVTAVPTETLPNASEVVLKLREDVAALSWMAKALEDAFALTEIVAVCEELTEAIFVVNEVDEAPEAIVTAVGTVTALLLLAALTLIPVDGAAELSETVHVVDPDPVKELLLHEKALIEACTPAPDPLRLMDVVLEVVPWVAVNWTVCGEVTADTLAAKFALDVPEGTVMEAGTDIAAPLLARVTSVPPLGADPLSFTVQVSEPAPIMVADAHVRPDRLGDEFDPLPWSFTDPETLTEDVDWAFTLSWPVESEVEPGS
jgi:hypothetical protein